MVENYIDKKKQNIYLDPKILLTEYDKSIGLGVPTEKLVVLFQKIAKNFATTFNSNNKCDLNACINFGVSEAWQKWNKFNPEKSDNLFSFYTTIISNDMKLHFKQITRGKGKQISLDALFSNSKE